MKHTVYLGLGSNVGNSVAYLADAIRSIARFEQTSVETVSEVYETEPVGDVAQNDFLNLAMCVHTGIDFQLFHKKIKALEQTIGRKETVRWGPREIDIDLLLFDDLVVDSDTLKIPHREVHQRKFVLQPLSEIAPDVIHPVLKKTITELNNESTDMHGIHYSELYTTQLFALINDSITDPTH
ncbi:MAG: 2-amino-4-hydroxy-6-hydroxymethyldihydropteridine diphosphokinase [Bacteroidota bacterium]|nr:2-amino-4-hydroxy-6-hydroxymethyldihydropteridine diphosphokinase [Bacteroidota bacterium]